MGSRYQNVAVCGDCWEDHNPGREPVRIVEDFREPEACHYCQRETRSGIYVRVKIEDKPIEPGRL